MKKTKVLLLLLSLSLVFSTIFPYVASAEESQKVGKPISNQNEQSRVIIGQSPIVFESDGTIYEMNTEETNSEVVITLKSNEGTQTFKRNKDADRIRVSSDYLTKNEIIELESSVNNIDVQAEKTSLINNSSLYANDENSSIIPMAQKGKWVWSGWSNITVTLKGKTTANAIAVAITSYIPGVGPIAGALATIIIQNGVKTGYFKKREGNRLDTDPRFVWRKTQTKVYKDKARKKLLSTKTTKPLRMYIHW